MVFFRLSHYGILNIGLMINSLSIFYSNVNAWIGYWTFDTVWRWTDGSMSVYNNWGSTPASGVKVAYIEPLANNHDWKETGIATKQSTFICDSFPPTGELHLKGTMMVH